METRSRARTKEGQSSSFPARPLEDSVPRPSSRASGSEGDLGLSTLLGDGEASIVGRGRASESAISGPCDVTMVAEQVPVSEPVLASSHTLVTGTTTLPGPRVQSPTRSPQIPTFEGEATAQIPTNKIHRQDVKQCNEKHSVML